jgi:hypothetical protein
MWNWKTRLAILAVPAALAVGGGAVVAHAAAPSPAPPSSSPAASDTSTEAPDTSPEPAEANEPGQPGGGHADQAGQGDHQWDGVE